MAPQWFKTIYLIKAPFCTEIRNQIIQISASARSITAELMRILSSDTVTWVTKSPVAGSRGSRDIMEACSKEPRFVGLKVKKDAELSNDVG